MAVFYPMYNPPKSCFPEHNEKKKDGSISLQDNGNQLIQIDDSPEGRIRVIAAFMWQQILINRPSQGNPKKEKTYEYFKKPDQSRQNPLQRLARPFVDYLGCKGIDLKTIELQQVLNLCVKRAFDQHEENPEHFVSHGFNHSLNVAEYIEQIVAANVTYAIDNQHQNILDALAKKYKISKNVAKFMLTLLALLHDCGYPHLKGKTKANHSICSADLIDDLKDNLFKLILKSSPDFSWQAYEVLFADFRAAIFYHNADKKEFHYQKLLKTDRGEFLCNETHLSQVEKEFENESPRRQKQEVLGSVYSLGRALDLKTPGDKLIGLPFRPANLTDHPFELFIRIADNMDMSKKRLSALQKEAVFQKIYRDLGTKKKLSHILEEYAMDLRNSRFGEEIKKVAKKLNEDSIKHYGSCECIERVQFAFANLYGDDDLSEENIDYKSMNDVSEEVDFDTRNLRHLAEKRENTHVPCVYVYVDQRKYEELERITFNESNDNGNLENLNVAMYQIWRARQAFKSLSYNNSSVPSELREIEVMIINPTDKD